MFSYLTDSRISSSFRRRLIVFWLMFIACYSVIFVAFFRHLPAYLILSVAAISVISDKLTLKEKANYSGLGFVLMLRSVEGKNRGDSNAVLLLMSFGALLSCYQAFQSIRESKRIRREAQSRLNTITSEKRN